MFLLDNVKYKDILNIDKLEIPNNQVTCIVGESGSGKTTLIKLLNKLYSYSKGDILYNGLSLKDIDSIDLRREVVMLPQVPIIFGDTIKENLLVGLKFSEKPMVSDDELIKVLNMVNLQKNLNNNADILSGGEKQRLALGRVILMDPEVFLMDEPTAALDETTEETVIERLIQYIKKTKKTLIIVTHSMKLAEKFSDYIITIENGRISKQEKRGTHNG